MSLRSSAKAIRSNGELAMRGYAVAASPAPAPEPSLPVERVVIVDPRRAETLTDPRSSGPRDPSQTVWPPPKAPQIELPDGQPLTKGQRIWIDPELLAQWEREEAARRQER